jgi:hypothetical protein
MAKGQVRSNREVRKPKKEKKPEKVESTFGSQIGKATGVSDMRRKPKG